MHMRVFLAIKMDLKEDPKESLLSKGCGMLQNVDLFGIVFKPIL